MDILLFRFSFFCKDYFEYVVFCFVFGHTDMQHLNKTNYKSIGRFKKKS